jgi:F-type H+-transporting ATPase subunit b
MELLENLGINGKILLAQIINFFILFWVLKKFAYKPVLSLLEERTKKIEKGLADAEKAHRKLEETEQKEKKVLTDAKKQAQEIIKKAEDQAEKNKEEIVAESKAKVEKLVVIAKKNIEEEKNKMIGEVKDEVAELVILATEKVTNKKINSESDKELIEEVIKK